LPAKRGCADGRLDRVQDRTGDDHRRARDVRVVGQWAAAVLRDVWDGIIDVQSCTLDDPEAASPGAHIQVAERLAWMADVAALPTFEQYPGM
jgi:hypothetical protein